MHPITARVAEERQVSTTSTEEIISLSKHWMANHYQNKDERFLGWLVVQPIEHRMISSELSREELEDFGIVTRRLEEALKSGYNQLASDDKVELVYLVRLGESTLGDAAEWHLHYHMDPGPPK